MNGTRRSTFHTATFADVENLLVEVGFTIDACLCNGVVLLIDALCDYREEGRHLYPQILLTNNLEQILKGIPFSKTLILEETSPSDQAFKSALKRAAPLATGGWSIFVEHRPGYFRYGLVSVESSIVSISLEANFISEQGYGPDSGFALIKNVGERLVRVKTQGRQLLVDFSLRTTVFANEEALESLVKQILRNINEGRVSTARNFIHRILDMALPFSHGNLVGVLSAELSTNETVGEPSHGIPKEMITPVTKDANAKVIPSLSAIDNLKLIAKGMFLPQPINLLEVIQDASEGGEDAAMRAYASLVRNMLNNDGITIFSTKCEVIGYHVFIDSKADAPNEREGGARTRAFEAMISSKFFDCCFFKSQDGFMKTWTK